MTVLSEPMNSTATDHLRDRLQALSESVKGLTPSITIEQVEGILQLTIEPNGLAWNWSKHFNYQ